MDVNNRIPSGVFSSIIAEVTATQGKNNSDVSHSCREFLKTFKFPTFEILVVMQVCQEATVTSVSKNSHLETGHFKMGHFEMLRFPCSELQTLDLTHI